MKKLKFLFILLINFVAGTIPYFAQTDTVKICHTVQEFKYYAGLVYQVQELTLDTSIMQKQMIELQKEIDQKDKAISIGDTINKQQKKLTTSCKEDNVVLKNTIEKAEKKANRNKFGTIVFGSTTAILLLLVTLKVL